MPPMTSQLPSKPHRCVECTRSFATSKALQQHRLSSHGMHCTVPGCTKILISSAALRAHISSPVHTLPGSSAPLVLVNSGAAAVPRPAPRTAVPNTVMQEFKCTTAGCNKIFKTSQSRAQHVASAAHRKKVIMPTANSVPKAFTPNGQPSASVPRKATYGESSFTTGAVAGRVVKKQSPQNSADHKKMDSVSKTAHPSGPKNVGKSARVPLYQWDTRWSSISTQNYGSIMSALKSLILSPEVSSTIHVDKKFSTQDRRTAPLQNSAASKRQAIVLDCEMVGVGSKGSTSELGRLSAIDFLTGELLIDTLVRPLNTVTDWRTQWSGITADIMGAAIASGDVLGGSPAARAELFKYMDTTTILVGHALHYDLGALGIRHSVTVDSAALAKQAVGKNVRKEWGLKVMCKELLRITVQDHGKDGHDSVEDTLAAREVVLWCLQHGAELKAWGARKKKEHFSSVNQRKSAARQNGKRPVVVERFFYDDDSDDYDHDSDEYGMPQMSLKEFNELCGYPEWYDNWSD